MIINSCSHCGSKAKFVCNLIADESYLVGWECTGCSESIIGVSKMIDYMARKMAMQWNMRAKIKEENAVIYEKQKNGKS